LREPVRLHPSESLVQSLQVGLAFAHSPLETFSDMDL